MKKIFFLLLLALNSPFIFAQLVIDNSSQTPQQLAQDVLLGQGITISNIKFNNSAISAATTNDQIGQFSNGATTNIGIDKGIILSTGNAIIAAGPNDQVQATLPTSNSVIGDNDLFILSNNQTIKSVAILEFDFVPTGNKLNFNFVFASEEYPEYVNETYNDNFGFFLSGPGITGTFSGNATNIALIPTTSLPVSINNLNNGKTNLGPCEYCQYYTDNTNGTTIQYDGFTKTIGATADVQCGQTYHMKLAIANVGDDNFDSAVFIEGASFSAAGIDLGKDLNLCSVNQYQLDSGLDASVIHQWTLDGQIIPSESGPTITVDKSGTYGVTATPLGTVCPATDDIKVVFDVVQKPTISCGTKTSNSIEFNWLSIPNITDYSISYKIGINPEIPIGSVGNVNSYTVFGGTSGDNISITVTPIGGTPADCIVSNSIFCTLDNCLISPTIILNQGDITQQICKNTAIIDVIYTIGGGATNTSITKGILPAGVTSSLVGNQLTISGIPTTAGLFDFTIFTSGGCGANASISGSINVVDFPTIILNQGSLTQQICKDTEINDVVFTIGGGATNASISSGNLPHGVTGSLVGNEFTITGNATSTGIFNYTISTSGGCGANANISGSITVEDSPTIILNQGSTTKQICKNAAISDTVFTIGGSATNASITLGALPAGVIASLVGNQYTISGIPTVAGQFDYTISTSGGCGTNASISGSITVSDLPSIILNQGSLTQKICKDSAIQDIIFTVDGLTNTLVSSGTLPDGVTSILIGNKYTISGIATTSGQFDYTVTISGDCLANADVNGSITVNQKTTPLFDAVNPICAGETLTALPILSNDGFLGKWNPALNNLKTTQYTFIPDTDQCANESNLTINVNPKPLPLVADGLICKDKITNAIIQSYVLDTKLNSADYNFEWFLDGIAIPSANGTTLEAVEKGVYSVIATNKTTNCASENVTATIAETFSDSTVIKIDQTNNFNAATATITISIVQGIGNYEFQLDKGIFQTSPVFSEVAAGNHSINIVDINGCYNLSEPIVVLGYPKFFTPNGDTNNDTWNIIGFSPESNPVISIFDRYGKLLKQISSNGNGWDGTYNGHPLPSTDYWFRVEFLENGIPKEFQSHFSLKR